MSTISIFSVVYVFIAFQKSKIKLNQINSFLDNFNIANRDVAVVNAHHILGLLFFLSFLLQSSLGVYNYINIYHKGENDNISKSNVFITKKIHRVNTLK
jgi:hypothetical protein